MATLTLTKVFINRLDTGQAVSAQSDISRAREHSIAGSVRTYAGGRQRAVQQVGERGSFDVRLRMVSLSTVDLLRTWQGIPVQVRDARGQRFFGVYFKVPVVELRATGEYDVPLSVQLLTLVEGV